MKTKNIYILLGITGSAAIGYALYEHLRARKNKNLVAYPKNVLDQSHTAVNAVTGGHPEEMNGMPPSAISV